MNIDTSLLREKFFIKEKNADKDSKTLEFYARSNRMSIALQAGNLPKEILIVRSNTMHNTVRMVAQIVTEYDRTGPIAPRTKLIDWQDLWEKTLSSYDHHYNPQRWVSIYLNGKSLYACGEHHPFLDVIEQCDGLHKGNYSESIPVAEQAFSKAGKSINLTYDSNVALVAISNKKEGRCSLAVRSPDRKATFNLNVRISTPEQRLNPAQSLTAAADFLEGIQLSFMIGLNIEKIDMGLIEKFSHEYKQTLKAKERIEQLDAQLDSLENRYKLRYRPERPDFNYIMESSKKCAKERIADENEVFIE